MSKLHHVKGFPTTPHIYVQTFSTHVYLSIHNAVFWKQSLWKELA